MTYKSNFNTALSICANVLCAATLLLIALGALVKSTGSGLSVPDWPTTYGRFMFAFPLDQMVGGIKYEHTHRMLASIVGLMSFGLCVWLFRLNVPLWIKRLGLTAFILVILQGVLGGLTVRYFLPIWLSTVHGVLAQTFLAVTILLAYALSQERCQRMKAKEEEPSRCLIRAVLIFGALVYVQLILGNLMRHAEAGLAVPDFPTMAGTMFPAFDQAMLERINLWRFENNLDPVTMGQVLIHLAHRFWAILVLFGLFYLNQVAYQKCLTKPLLMKTVFFLNIVVALQIMLGIATIMTGKGVSTTTIHVAMGAVVLSLAFLLFLRAAPLSLREAYNVIARPEGPKQSLSL